MLNLSIEQSGLSSCYSATIVEAHDLPISVDLEIPRWLAEEERRKNKRPTVLFRRVKEYPNATLLGNPYPREVMLAALGVDASNWAQELARRLNSAGPVAVKGIVPSWESMSGLDQLPVVHHRPGDAGRYITAGITVTKSLDSGRLNLGVYRIQVVGRNHARIFFDPRTDAYRNWQESVAAGMPLPVAVFLGADPAYMLVAASRLPSDLDDYDIVARLLSKEIRLTGDLPVPSDAHYVLRGYVTEKLETEGPFAEFKGFYAEARKSPVLVVESVLRSKRPIYPTIVTGAESGLTLMAMQNEYLMYAHLVESSLPVTRVRYPLDGLGEFVALIETEHPSEELLQVAMAFDRRSKLVICGPRLALPWQSLATFGFKVHHEPYYRKGIEEGRRVGLILDQPPVGSPVEY